MSILKSAGDRLGQIRRTALVLVSFVVSLAVFTGCDPGYRYRPKGWMLVESSVATWSATIRGMTFSTPGITGLIGSRGIIPEFDIENPTERTLVLDRAELQVGSASYLGRFASGGAIQWRSVGPRATQRITISWEFERPALEVLGTNPSLMLDFRLDDEQDSVTIVYERHQ